MLGDNAAVHIKELADCFLRQPDIIVLHTNFESFLMGILRKDKEIDRAVTDLQFVSRHRVSPSRVVV